MPEIIPNLHPLLVHFPIALVSVSAFFHVATLALRGNPACARHCVVLAHATLWLGALAALPTAFIGWQAFNSVNHDEAGHVAMLAHRAWALSTLAVLTVLAGWDVWRSKMDAIPAKWFAGAVVGAWGLIAVTAWHGGELVYRYGLGVMSLPVAETGHAQGHEHGAMSPGEENTHTNAMPEGKAQEHSQHEHMH